LWLVSIDARTFRIAISALACQPHMMLGRQAQAGTFQPRRGAKALSVRMECQSGFGSVLLWNVVSVSFSKLGDAEHIDLASAVVRKGQQTFDGQRIGNRPCDAFGLGGLLSQILKPGHVPSPCTW
jgi:hypothetical protein